MWIWGPEGKKILKNIKEEPALFKDKAKSPFRGFSRPGGTQQQIHKELKSTESVRYCIAVERRELVVSRLLCVQQAWSEEMGKVSLLWTWLLISFQTWSGDEEGHRRWKEVRRDDKPNNYFLHGCVYSFSRLWLVFNVSVSVDWNKKCSFVTASIKRNGKMPIRHLHNASKVRRKYLIPNYIWKCAQNHILKIFAALVCRFFQPNGHPCSYSEDGKRLWPPPHCVQITVMCLADEFSQRASDFTTGMMKSLKSDMVLAFSLLRQWYNASESPLRQIT